MIVKDYIKRFERHGFGMFVHFGLYSNIALGEWAYNNCPGVKENYHEAFEKFNPDPDWAEKLVATAKSAGCKYITLTTRHHDGFSLYDTCGLNDYDAPHSPAGRDLIREFVDQCNAQGIIPFFYHTLLDWYEPHFNTDFPKYLEYLRASVEILCTRYGKIGGLWFDGKWSKPNEDWEEDALYGLIRKHQPEAMIINNTGLVAPGALGHIELDSVTFERGKPAPINLEGSPKYIASEMCQIFGDHWAYAENDFNFKSLGDIIKDFCICRRYGSNLLLNVGPMGNGKLRNLDTAMLEAIGKWIEIYKDAFDGTRPTDIEVEDKPEDFLLRGEDGSYYLFCHNILMSSDPNVTPDWATNTNYLCNFKLDAKIKSVKWLESGADVEFHQNGDSVSVRTTPQPYGQSMVVRVAKIEV